MKKYIFRALVGLLTIVSLTSCYSSAKGYIVTNSGKKVYGEFRVTKINNIELSYYVNNINTDTYNYCGVQFAPDDDKKYKLYYPDSLRSFGFNFEYTPYYFNTFLIHMKSMVSREKERRYFLSLLYKDKYNELYRNTLFDPSSGLLSVSRKMLRTDSYYLYKPDIGAVKVEKGKDFRTIKELLDYFGFDQDFIRELPEKYDFVNIKTILILYKNWKENNQLFENEKYIELVR